MCTATVLLETTLNCRHGCTLNHQATRGRLESARSEVSQSEEKLKRSLEGGGEAARGLQEAQVRSKETAGGSGKEAGGCRRLR